MSEKYPSLVGNKYNRLTVLSLCLENKRKYRRWNCLCECGNKSIVTSSQLMKGLTISCGCYGKEQRLKGVIKHGKRYTKEYFVWARMKSRCLNPKDKRYMSYGGRGVTICGEWVNDFECFIKDMGLRPSKNHSIDRIDVNGNYEPSNCRWATIEEQSRNKRLNVFYEYNGEKLIAKDWAKKLNIGFPMLRYHLKTKSIQELIHLINLRELLPIRKEHKSRMLTCGETTLQVKDWAEKIGVNKGSVHRWLSMGKNICEIVEHFENKNAKR